MKVERKFLPQIGEVHWDHRKGLWADMRAESSDPFLTKQDVIVKAMQRLCDKLRSLDRLVTGEDVGVEGKDRYSRLPDADIGEFLETLPDIVNEFTIWVFDIDSALFNDLYVRQPKEKKDGGSMPSGGDKR